ncbi:MAG: hypothetical protein KAX19_06645, partial [Candidatus Brocadiae bacterium]|nr:hypothetical protein [Candidatus Brocadiia bacterium]
AAGEGIRLEESQWLVLENYDDRVVAKVGDKEVLSHEYEGGAAGERRVRFGARGATVLWERIIIERDIYYNTVHSVRGAGRRYELGEGEYFVLGDNSPASSDSRRWARPGVPQENLIGKAFFVFWPVHYMRRL